MRLASTLSRKSRGTGQLLLFLANVAGAVIYVFQAKQGWMNPVDVQYGIQPTGEPFVWAVAILPVVAIFFIMNLVWLIEIVARKNWRGALFWFASFLVWSVAVVIDFAHHFVVTFVPAG